MYGRVSIMHVAYIHYTSTDYWLVWRTFLSIVFCLLSNFPSISSKQLLSTESHLVTHYVNGSTLRDPLLHSVSNLKTVYHAFLCCRRWGQDISTGVIQKVLPVLSTETLLHIWLSSEYYGFRPSSTAVDTGDTRGLIMSK